MDKILRSLELDLLHVHEACTPSVSRAAVIAAEVPVVGTFHAAADSSFMYPFLYGFAIKCMAAMAVKIAVSPAAVEFVSKYFPTEEYRIIPNGVDTAVYAAAQGGRRCRGGSSSSVGPSRARGSSCC